MADRNKDLHLDDNQEGGTLAENRITELSGKVKKTAEERDAEVAARKIAEDKANASQKEVDFYKGFTGVAGKYQGASEHAEEIKAKVLAGYDIEDATVSVLNKQGKLKATPRDIESPAGGSATTTNVDTSRKSPKDMTQEERRKALVAAEASGDISVS